MTHELNCKIARIDPTKEKIIITTDMILKAEHLKQIREALMKQYNEDGFLVLPAFIKVVISPHNVIEIKLEEEA